MGGSFDFVKDSYEIKEISENPGGLHYRFLIKAMIPVSFGVLIFTAIGYTIKNIRLFRQAVQHRSQIKDTVGQA